MATGSPGRVAQQEGQSHRYDHQYDGDPVLVAMNPITLTFYADPALEQTYREKTYQESFIVSIGGLLVLIALAVGREVTAGVVPLVVILCLRVWLYIMSDQQQAYMLNCGLAMLWYASMSLVDAQDEPSERRNEPAYTEIGVLLALSSLHARQTALPGELRLLVEGFVVISSFMNPAERKSGPPSQSLFVLAVLLVSELFGHTLEVQRRLAHAETRRRLAEAEQRATTMEEETGRLRRHLTSMLSDHSAGASLTADQLEGLVGREALAAGLQLRDLDLDRRVGTGGFAAVYLAYHRGGATVALKRPHRDCSEEQLVRFVREVTMLKQLSHPNIVSFVGVMWEPSLVLALEWMKGGSVHDVLKERRTSLEPSSIALHVARGMAYLHSVGLCHRDLKAANILLDDASPPTAKVADFGLSRYLGGDGLLSPRLSQVGTPLWSAPEVRERLAGGRAAYTLSCDVYSFAIFLLELEDFTLVHRSMACSQCICQWMASGWRPSPIELRGMRLLWLVQGCWAQVSRPIGPRLPRSCLCSPRAARLPPLPPSSHSPPRMAPRPRVARPNNGQRLDMAAAAPAAARRQPALPTEVACTAGAALTAACQRAGRKAACSSGSRGTRSPAIAAVGVRGQAFLTRVPLPPSELLHHQPVSLTLGSARRLPQCLPGARTQAAGLACR